MKLKINYPPNFEVRWTKEKNGHSKIHEIIGAQRTAFLEFISDMAQYESDFREIPLRAESDTVPQWRQRWFLPMDGMSCYTIVASRKPRRVFEIGSGNSTKFFAHAKFQHSNDTKILSIDPHPRTEIDQLCDAVYRTPLETSDLSLFDSLESGDVVFFDGSHRSFQNSDVTVFFLEVLPRLRPGVIVGLHDIFLPFDYPESWLNRYYNEQYMLATHILASPKPFPVFCSCSYIYHHMQEELRASFSKGFHALFPRRLAHFHARINGLCFWFENRK